MTKPATSHFSGLQLDRSAFTSASGTYDTKRFNSSTTDENFEKFWNKTNYMVEAPVILMHVKQISR